MKFSASSVKATACIMLFILLCLFQKEAKTGAVAGIELCLYSIIPSLFPFLFLSAIMTTSFSFKSSKITNPIIKMCGIPQGAESIFLSGILGGYPAGAQSIAQAYKDKRLTNRQADHMLRFCNNAGPAFIFGILGSVFEDFWLCLLIWVIQIFCALLTGYIFHDGTQQQCAEKSTCSVSMSTALLRSIRAMGQICGWIVLFKIILSILTNTIFNKLPQMAVLLITGILELSNGCVLLNNIGMDIAFCMGNFLLSFGGFCIWMQTKSLLGELKIGSFIAGKCVQSYLCTLLSICIASFCFNSISSITILSIMCFILSVIIGKKVVAFHRKVLYNKENKQRRTRYAVP